MNAFCRDCHSAAGERSRCPACGSPRLLRHAELSTLAIAHIDSDAFYASVEKRDNPELRDRPVIVGGGQRGVVSAACYVARLYGVRSAMPMFKALAACPDAVVIRPNMARYVEVSREVRTLMLACTPLVEPLSLDEAFLDLTGTEKLHRQPPFLTLAKLADRIEREIGITVSIGLSYNKSLAKLASEMDKPRGFALIGRAEARAVLAERPVSDIWGVGKVFRQRLADDGITRIGQLQSKSEVELVGRYGAMGRRLARLARGEDERNVDPAGEMRSVSAETTFNQDLKDRRRLEGQLWSLCEKVSRRLKAKSLAGRTVVLKLKTADFRLRTRSHSLADPTQLAETMFQAAVPLLAKECDGTPFRLIGVGLANIVDAAQADPPGLLDPSDRRIDIERTIDAVRARFGTGAIGKGRNIP